MVARVWGVAMATDVDIHLGNQIRRRRRLLGLTQRELAEAVGTKFQQVQKYECGANRVSAGRLFQISEALRVPIGYFYMGLEGEKRAEIVADSLDPEILSQKETLDLVRAYYRIGQPSRRRLLDLAVSLDDDQHG